MSSILSQQEFWLLVRQSSRAEFQGHQTDLERFDQTWVYPTQFGEGYYREIRLREGLHIEITDCRHHTPFVMECCDRTHPVELHFDIFEDAPKRTSTAGQYWLYSSGLAPAKRIFCQPHPRSLSLSLHIEPEVFQNLLGEVATLHLPNIGYLVKASDTPYASHCRSTSPAMAVILQQILNCPYSGAIRRLFLEGKVLELMALSLQSAMPSKSASSHRLKSDDIERIHQARAILLQNLSDPPSLLELARQVGLNDCTLKRGFRQVFNTTVFGCLQQHRMDQARQLLLEEDLSVQQAAHAVGYLSRSHFTAAFRKRFGVSPRELLTRGG